MLGQRGDMTALPVVLESLKSEEKVIRMAAVPAAAKLGELKVLEDLMGCLETDQEDEARVGKEALMDVL